MPPVNFIASLHGLRGMAALTVLVGHFRGMTGIPEWSLAPSLGVVLFFVLSGFLMGHLYLDRRPTPREIEDYLVARFARVYPLFASVILAAGILYLLAGSTPFGINLSDIIPHLLLTGAGGTVWTISVEFQFYIVFGLLWIGISLLPKWRGEAVLAIAAISIFAVMFFGYPPGRIDFLRYAHVFLIGMATAVLLKKNRPMFASIAPYLLPAALIYYLAAFVAIPRFYNQNNAYGDIIVCLVSAMLVLFSASASPREHVTKILSSKVMVWMGELSFGIYLLHRMVDFVWKGIDPFGIRGVGKWLILFCLTLLAAWVANRLIEVPARAKIRELHRSIRRRPIVDQH